MTVARYQESIAWQKAMDLSVTVYEVTRIFPKEELFGLTSQLRRASVSVASNAAEGQGRATRGELIQFLGMARGSALEVETQLELARRLGLGVDEDIQRAKALSAEVIRILNAAIKGLRTPPPKPG